MLGKIKTIIQFTSEKRCIVIEVNGVTAKTYIVNGNRNSKHWERITVGDELSGLEWFDEGGKIIDADSPIIILR